MKNLIKIAGLTIALWLLNSSCASYKNVTIEPCLPKEKITLTEKATNYISNADSLYFIKTYENLVTKDSGIRFERKLMGF